MQLHEEEEGKEEEEGEKGVGIMEVEEVSQAFPIV